MTSRKLYFNLLKENARRRLSAIALLSLIFFFLYPVGTALIISNLQNPENFAGGLTAQAMAQAQAQMKTEILNTFLSLTSIQNGFAAFILVVAAILCGTTGFSYLHSRKKTDFFHSIPVKREKLFALVYLNGFLFTAIPYLVNLILASIVVQVKAAPDFPWAAVLSTYLCQMAFYLLIYSTVILAVMLTGNAIVGLLGSGVFFFWGPVVHLLKAGYYATYFITYPGLGDDSAILERSSPLFWYMGAVGGEEKTGTMALWALLAALLLAVLSVLLYKRRPSEAAGRAMAFNKSRAVIKALIVVPSGLAGSLFFFMMKSYDGWSLFGLACGVLISYSVIEIIYHFDFKRLFAHKGQLTFCFLCSALLLSVFRFDLIGYDSYLPSERKLESGGIYVYTLDSEALDYTREPRLQENRDGSHDLSWTYPNEAILFDRMKLSDTQTLLAIARQGIEDARSIRHWNWRRGDVGSLERDAGSRDAFGSVSIAYHLKSGKTVRRKYYTNLTKAGEHLDAVYDQAEYKEAVYPVLNWDAGDIAGINYQEYDDFRHVRLSGDEQKNELLETYQKELAALTADIRRKENPIAAIQFKTNEMQAMIDVLKSEDKDYRSFNSFYYFPVYPSFTGTISILKNTGIDAGHFLNSENVAKIALRGPHQETYRETEKAPADGADIMGEEKTYKNTKMLVTDKTQISEILAVSVSENLNCSNHLNSLAHSIEVTAYVPQEAVKSQEEFSNMNEARRDSDDSEGEYDTYRIYLDSDRIPEFVKNKFSCDSEQEQRISPYGY